MTATFQIGDKVTALGQRSVTITYGPFMSTFDRHEMYVAADGADRERSYQTTDLTALPAFAVGDAVRFMDRPAKIAGGPIVGYVTGDRIYLVTFTDGMDAGKGDMARESGLFPAPADEPIKVGDRVRVLVDQANNASVKAGDVFTVAELVTYAPGLRTAAVPERSDGWFFSLTNVERVDDPPANTYTHDGVTYDLSARYEDRDGDEWTFTYIEGEARGRSCHCCEITEVSTTLTSAVDSYGPLIKI